MNWLLFVLLKKIVLNNLLLLSFCNLKDCLYLLLLLLDIQLEIIFHILILLFYLFILLDIVKLILIMIFFLHIFIYIL